MIYRRVPDRNCFVGVDLMGENSQISYLQAGRVSGGAVPVTIREAPVQLRRLIPVLTEKVPADRIRTICFTAQGMNSRMEELLRSAAQEAGLEGVKILCEDHLRSFYSYLLTQEESQKKKDVLLLEGTGESVCFTRLGISRRTKPFLCWPKAEKTLSPVRGDEASDAKLADFLSARLREEEATAVYLAGSLFEGGWLRKTAEVIARGRKAFAGDNLFSRGAVCSCMAAEGHVQDASRYFFLPPDSLRYNLGLRCRRKYAEILLPVLEAGTRWETARSSQELIMEEGSVLEAEVRSVTDGASETLEIHLDPFPERGGVPARIRVTFSMTGPETVRMEAEDLGFGEIFPSSGMRWEKDILLRHAADGRSET